MKYEWVLPFSMHRCLIGIFSKESSLKTEPGTRSILTTRYCSIEDLEEIYEKNQKTNAISKYKRGMVCNQAVVDLPFPLNCRNVNSSFTFIYDSESKSVICGMKAFESDFSNFATKRKVETKNKFGNIEKSKCYSIFNFGFFKLQKIEDNKTLFIQVSLANPGGWVNDKNLMKVVSKSRGIAMRKSYMKVMSELPKDIHLKDCEKEFNKVDENGMPIDGLGKLLFEMNMKFNIEN
jgi:hypothetical protein